MPNLFSWSTVDECEHTYSCESAHSGRKILPNYCGYCKYLIWGLRETWKCDTCGKQCHKECVPHLQRLRILREVAMNEIHCGEAVILYSDNNRGNSDVVEYPDELSDSDAPPQPTLTSNINFEFPTKVKIKKHPSSTKNFSSANNIATVLRDCVGDRNLFKGIKWRLSSIKQLSSIHQRRYDRRIASATPAPTNIISEVRANFKFARSAYGSGKLTSTLRRDEIIPREYMAAVLQNTGWVRPENGTILYWSWCPTSKNKLTPGYYIGVDIKSKKGVVGIRGTISQSDILIDVNGTPLSHEEGFAHNGILLCAKAMLMEVSETLENTFLSPESDYFNWPVCITGHSLGGGVAASLLLLIKKHPILSSLSVNAIGYGTPPCLSNTLCDQIFNNMITVVNHVDMCPRMTLSCWDQLVAEMSMPDNLWGCLHIPAAVAAALCLVLSTQNYCLPSRVNKDVSNEYLRVPGRVLILHPSEGEKQISLFDVTGQSALSGIHFSFGMLSCHPWKAYHRSVAQL